MQLFLIMMDFIVELFKFFRNQKVLLNYDCIKAIVYFE